MSILSQIESVKTGSLYKALRIEQFFTIIDQTDLTLTLYVTRTNNKITISKKEFLHKLQQQEILYVDQISDDEVQKLRRICDTSHQLKKSYDDYHRRKQSIISSELLSSGIQEQQ